MSEPLTNGAEWQGQSHELPPTHPLEIQKVRVEDWCVEDDVLLCDALEEGATLEALAHGVVRFSHSFSVKELSQRWQALLYDPNVSIPAAKRMACVPSPLRQPFQQAHPLVKTLYEQAHPRKDGAVKQEEELPPGFSDVELAVVHAERGFAAFPSPSAAAIKDENMDSVDADSKTAECSGMPLEAHDLRGLKSRWQGRTRRKDILAINHLERTSMAATSRRLSKAGTLAVLRGYKTCYAIKKTEVVVGRSTEQQAVDIDLALEGSATKVSRLQARIKLCQGVFKLINVGRRAIFVNNTMVESGYQRQLEKNALVEVGGLRFLFQVNSQNVSSLMRHRLPNEREQDVPVGTSA
mmetsp:Transcript_894/g.1576  ORF Transcript_894/g.1576 Transcript_894/m.1576 type:complete len:352 (+) Transcript_894:116-1171(+)|eukprot:CAMPEP_0198206050 /NCGR_PEP_ID=MMETSP1445-20131203/9579_1 /TAXON_ID=36898 /ORGANISM="Pyramimonas sp., Strain CCMP2087" /LENGTH=351 /DNA_ID=CAMNT_0043878585 /DNA_START=116 /DNA_END=1171 /DNA_ORIENTATION=-